MVAVNGYTFLGINCHTISVFFFFVVGVVFF